MLEDNDIIVLQPDIIDIKVPDYFATELIISQEIKSFAQAAEYNFCTETQNINESSCEHYHMIVQTRINILSAICCYFCCFLGVITSFIGMIINRFCEYRGTSSFKNNNKLYFQEVYEVDDRYNIKNLSNRIEEDDTIRRTIVDLNCIKMQKPHHFTINCENCNKTLKSGYTAGSMKLALLCGIFGMIALFISLLSFIFHTV